MSILHGHNDVVRKVTWEPSGSFLVRPFYPHVTVSTCLPLTVIVDFMLCRRENYCMGSHSTRTQASQTHRWHYSRRQGQGVRWTSKLIICGIF